MNGYGFRDMDIFRLYLYSLNGTSDMFPGLTTNHPKGRKASASGRGRTGRAGRVSGLTLFQSVSPNIVFGEVAAAVDAVASQQAVWKACFPAENRYAQLEVG